MKIKKGRQQAGALLYCSGRLIGQLVGVDRGLTECLGRDDRRDTERLFHGRDTEVGGRRFRVVVQEGAEDGLAVIRIPLGVQNVLVPHGVDIGIGTGFSAGTDAGQEGLVADSGHVDPFLIPALGRETFRHHREIEGSDCDDRAGERGAAGNQHLSHLKVLLKKGRTECPSYVHQIPI